MEIINADAANLSNYEVLVLLQQVKGKHKQGSALNQLATITYEATRYLQETPCSQQNPKMIRDFMKALGPYKLTKAEKLMMLNNPPTSQIDIQVMVEESEERLTDSQVEELLQTAVQCGLVPSAQ
ncbi:DNA-directed RNA polymerase III subunit RPC9 [Bacillus rossius redtenbacheri]|uniref:DNA-directed RNA polymerase III subunit RPC9 n=1 Tax=Bacillus rossius redtenbacheri TaxID=93214 RepID=UPI002FDCA834